MTRAATQEERWDRDRDYRKHDPRPGDPQPINAVEVAVLVKMVDTLKGAELIEDYARAKAAADRLDAVAAGARP